LRELNFRGTRLSLLAFLRFHSTIEVTRDRDYALALLDLAIDADNADLDPDYESSLETLFTKYARLFFSTDELVELL
jgi:hypothetical protein